MLIGEQVTKKICFSTILIICGENMCSEQIESEGLSPCTQEEADSRMLLHAVDDV